MTYEHNRSQTHALLIPRCRLRLIRWALCCTSMLVNQNQVQVTQLSLTNRATHLCKCNGVA